LSDVCWALSHAVTLTFDLLTSKIEASILVLKYVKAEQNSVQ